MMGEAVQRKKDGAGSASGGAKGDEVESAGRAKVFRKAPLNGCAMLHLLSTRRTRISLRVTDARPQSADSPSRSGSDLVRYLS